MKIRWWSDRGRALAIYAVLGTALLTVMAIRSGQFEAVHRMLMGSFAVACGYAAAVRILNSTTLVIRGDALRVQHGPLPWASPVEIAVAQIDDLAVDPSSGRLQLRTQRGEEIELVDDLTAASKSRLNEELSQLLRAGNRDDG